YSRGDRSSMLVQLGPIGTAQPRAANAARAVCSQECSLELWVRDSEHKSHVSSRRLESCSGDVVIDVVVDDGRGVAQAGRGLRLVGRGQGPEQAGGGRGVGEGPGA